MERGGEKRGRSFQGHCIFRKMQPAVGGLDLKIPRANSDRGRVGSQDLVVITCLTVGLNRQLQSQDSFPGLALKIRPRFHR